MLALLLTVLASATPAFASASVTCPDGPASCDAAALLDPTALDGDAAERAQPRDYATPAEIECPTPAALTLVGECDGTPRDLWYRASRTPDSERGVGGLVVASRPGRDRARTIPACDGVPRDGGDLTISSPQPVALFALPALVLDDGGDAPPNLVFSAPFRIDEPLERPPRA